MDIYLCMCFEMLHIHSWCILNACIIFDPAIQRQRLSLRIMFLLFFPPSSSNP